MEKVDKRENSWGDLKMVFRFVFFIPIIFVVGILSAFCEAKQEKMLGIAKKCMLSETAMDCSKCKLNEEQCEWAYQQLNRDLG